MWKKFMGGAAALAAVSLAWGAQAATIQGAGGTFPAPVYAKWNEQYKAQTGEIVNYQAIGSGAGIRAIMGKTVDFGASDKPLKAEELAANGFVQVPTVIGGITPVVNIPGVAPGQLKLSGPILADIFRGVIKKWNDPKITAINAGVNLPGLPITVVHRSDSSGTTFVFTSYLAMVAPMWSSAVGANDSVQWPTGVGGKGNDGVAAGVKQTPGAIGYVEFAYAKTSNMTYTQVQAQNGSFVQPSAAAFSAAAANANWKAAPGYYLLLLNQPGANAWPITAATFVLVYKKQADAATGANVLKYLDWTAKNGDAAARGLDYVPLPDSLKAMVHASLSTVVGPDGKALLK
ncbi:MAG: pstS [Caulobacteraceae bacterium]|nr:pstS [Caulobacteraceae bacterium]